MNTKYTKTLIALFTIGLMAGTGATIAQAAVTKDDEAKELQLFSQAKISLSDAIKTAEQKVGGKALEADLDDEAKTVQFEVEVVKEGKIHKVMVDGKTGKALSVALDDEAKEGAEAE
jgi:uncharacterized membrane protein YkoI